MELTTYSTLLAIGFLAVTALFGLALLWACLRIGPTRGTWNQPAAALRRPGRRMFLAMYALAILHVIVGLIAAFAVPGGGIGIFLVLLFTGVFYVLCAHSWSLAHTLHRRRRREPVEG